MLDIKITVAGVPKKGAKALKSLEEFKDNFIFDYKYTNKNTILYQENGEELELIDYTGKKGKAIEKYSCVLLPTTYELGKSQEYCELISDFSGKRKLFNE